MITIVLLWSCGESPLFVPYQPSPDPCDKFYENSTEWYGRVELSDRLKDSVNARVTGIIFFYETNCEGSWSFFRGGDSGDVFYRDGISFFYLNVPLKPVCIYGYSVRYSTGYYPETYTVHYYNIGSPELIALLDDLHWDMEQSPESWDDSVLQPDSCCLFEGYWEDFIPKEIVVE